MRHAPALLFPALLSLAGCWVVELPSEPPDAGLKLDYDNSDLFGKAGNLTNCQPNETYCVGQVLYHCDKKGTKWATEDCAATKKNCVKITKEIYACTDKLCAPKTASCDTDGLTTLFCSDDGKKWDKGMICDFVKDKKICEEGKCVEACGAPSKTFNKGCKFFTANLPNYESDQIGFLVHNVSKLTAKVQLSDGTRGLDQADIAPGKQATLKADVGTNMVWTSGHKKSWGFELSSNVPVEVMQISPLGISPQTTVTQRSSDGTMVFPWHALGDSYYAATAPVSNKEDMAYVAVVGSYPGTKVTIKPSADTLAGDGIPALKKGQSWSTTLEIKDLVVVATKTLGADLTGTEVKTSGRVAVFSGNSCLNLPTDKDHCDHAAEQILPVGSLGPSYIGVKFTPRGKTPEKDHWRIYAPNLDPLKVTITTGKSASVEKALKKGEILDYETAETFHVTSKEFFYVAHYARGQATVPLPLDATFKDGVGNTSKKCPTDPKQGNLGDPAMSLLVPHRNYAEAYNLLVPKNYKYDFVTITIPSSVNQPIIVFDGKVLNQPLTRIRGTYYFYTRLRVTDGVHTVSANKPFGLEVHGYDCNTGYAYNGGMLHEQTKPD